MGGIHHANSCAWMELFPPDATFHNLFEEEYRLELGAAEDGEMTLDGSENMIVDWIDGWYSRKSAPALMRLKVS